MAVVAIEFLKTHGRYRAGDRAGYRADRANKLVAQGFAKRVGAADTSKKEVKAAPVDKAVKSAPKKKGWFGGKKKGTDDSNDSDDG